MWHVSCQRHFAKGQGLRGAFHRELASGKFNVFTACLKLVSGYLFSFINDLINTSHDGRSSNRETAGAISSHSEGYTVTVAMDNLYVFHRYAKAIGNQLREGSLVPLTM